MHRGAGAATGGRGGITVSTLKEAEQFFAAGITDILYAVCIAPAKLAQALALRRAAATSSSSPTASPAPRRWSAAANAEAFEVLIEIDFDGHRSGVAPESATAARDRPALHEGGAASVA